MANRPRLDDCTFLQDKRLSYRVDGYFLRSWQPSVETLYLCTVKRWAFAAGSNTPFSVAAALSTTRVDNPVEKTGPLRREVRRAGRQVALLKTCALMCAA